ncbi:MAG: hypothetical protein AAFX93_10720 [Verrucomicrobiota bacterium]
MNERLVSYLQDNRDQVIENWLTEADVPAPPNAPSSEGFVPVSYLEVSFDRIVARIQCGDNDRADSELKPAPLTLNDIFNTTCSCQASRVRGRVCIELHESGRRAFMSVFNDAWDADGEFSALDRKYCEQVIGGALAWNFSNEVFNCSARQERADCQFNLK